MRRKALLAAAGVAALATMKPVSSSAPGGLIERVIPASGERLPVIGVGTWQTFDVGTDKTARGALNEVLAAFAKGGGFSIFLRHVFGQRNRGAQLAVDLNGDGDTVVF